MLKTCFELAQFNFLMSHFSLIYLGLFSLTITVLSFFNIIYSYYFNLYLNQNSYIYSLILNKDHSSFLNHVFHFSKKKSKKYFFVTFSKNIFQLKKQYFFSGNFFLMSNFPRNPKIILRKPCEHYKIV
mgnify:CR=1 FL=1